MRLLHARVHSGDHQVSGTTFEPDLRRYSTRFERQLLPLRNLRRNPCRRAGQRARENVMSEYQWPDPATRPLLGKRISRVDGPIKVSGRAKYTYDYNPDGLLA